MKNTTLIVGVGGILLLFALTGASGQTTVTVVDGATSTSRYGVIYEWRSGTGYSLYQHIYKQSLVNQAGTIESIQFEHTANTGSNTNVKIYLGEVAKTSFSGTTDWVNSGLTEVYSGTLTPTSGFYTITLSTPFDYSNTNSLILAVHQDGGTTPNNSAYIHLYDAADANVTLYNYSSSSVGTYGSWSSTGYTRQAILPSLKLTFAAGTCTAPTLDAKADAADAITICSGGSITLTANSTGGAACGGSFEYAWYTGDGTGNTYWDGTDWDNVATYNTAYSAVAGIVPTSTTTYKVKVRCSTDVTCNNTDATGVAVTVLPAFDPGNITGGGGTICNGGNPGAMTANPSGGAGTYTYQWYYRDGATCPDDGTSTIIGGETSASYDPPTCLTTTRSYRCKIDATGTPDCGESTWSTNCVTVTVQNCSNTVYPVDGGFEVLSADPSSNTLAFSSTQANWTRWDLDTYTYSATGGRSGPHYLTIGETTAGTSRLRSQTTNTVNQNIGYIVQYYYKNAGATNNLELYLQPDGSTTLGTATSVTANNASWTKAVYTVTSRDATPDNYGHLVFRFNGNSTNNINLDDICVYSMPEDNAVPDPPTSPTAGTITGKSIALSWTAPASGVDGGGYLLVYGTADPATAPNTNGIYAVGNTIASGTVGYIGTSTSATISDLCSNTNYWFRIYTYDKAFNYSTAATLGPVTTNPSLIFSNTNAQAVDSWDVSLTKTISVCGLSSPMSSPSNVLRQVNIDLGDNTNSRALTTYVITLRSPVGTTITIKSATGTLSSVTRFNVKYRDHSVLQTPQFYGSTKDPFDIGYYRTNTADDFSIFNGEDPNGTWTVTITETSAATGIAYNKVDLIFGSALVYNDISASTANDQCTATQCLETGTIIIGTNNGYTGPATDPSTTSTDWTPLCAWNGAKNNSAWFYFSASATTAKFTISGLDNNTQILAYTMSGTCAAPTYSLVTGGCPTSAANDTYTAPQYANGCLCNMQLNLSSLTVGNTYYVIVDGVGGVVSDFYIEMESGADESCTVLPIELLSYTAICNNQNVILKWCTASETNNNYFSIERSKNATVFEQVGTVQGAGNSNSLISYSWIDDFAESAPAYYRLKQTDFNGSNVIFEPLYTDCSKNTSNQILVYNTSEQNEAGYTIITGSATIFSIAVYDIVGQSILNEKIFCDKGISNGHLNIPSAARGIYIISFINESSSERTNKYLIVK
ncbi:MAG: fibronectin type III domain-containing protein [Bacteroidetes bacterium]|nr:fibronectin type III domain-containing protein [Bacteroidota bacterium]MBU1720859.1 fibronectin type III domain-containing protein [Bacteroidota bacterium]